MAQIKKEFEEAKLAHARELAEVRKKANEGGRNGISPAIPSTFTKKLKASYSWSALRDDARWHSMNEGDIFYTDGISRKETLRSGTYVQELDCYLATDSSGKLAFVYFGHCLVTR